MPGKGTVYSLNMFILKLLHGKVTCIIILFYFIELISTSEWRAEHQFAGQNTQHLNMFVYI